MEVVVEVVEAKLIMALHLGVEMAAMLILVRDRAGSLEAFHGV